MHFVLFVDSEKKKDCTASNGERLLKRRVRFIQLKKKVTDTGFFRREARMPPRLATILRQLANRQ